jgi:hypothetical protein
VSDGSRVPRLSLTKTLLVFLLALTIAAPAASGAALGVYTGAANPSGITSWGDWLEREPTYAVDFLASDTWNEISDPIWWLDGWQGSPYHVVYSVPMVPSDGSTLSEGATGAYDHHFTRLAQNLVNYGFGDSTIRLGWEFNGNWFAWAASSDPAAFITYWQRIVTAMRAVDGAAFRFDWNPIAGGDYPADLVYPGDDWVDVIGLDVYDQGWWAGWEDPANRWNELVNKPYGLQWHRDFALAHGKPVSFPEFGLSDSPAHHGGGDDPYFVERMYEWIGQSKDNVEYYAYFEFAGPIGNSALTSGSFPVASARFQELFSVDPPPLDPSTPEPEPVEEALEPVAEDETVRLPASVGDTTIGDDPVVPEAIPVVLHARHA